jgi:hypothetical protein
MIIKKFEIFNEGWKNWISGLMILFNLGVVGKDSNNILFLFIY